MATYSAPSQPGGSNTQVQFNDGGAFGGDADLTYNKTTNVLTNRGDINLDDGGTFTTTVQCITPTANRVISFPNATGTVGLVGGSSGQLVWNNAGAYAGASTLTYDGSILTTSGRFINSYNATASNPAKVFTGTWFTGGTTTTTKPQVLIEPTGTTSTAWSTAGTGLGVNAPSGFTGNLLDLQVNGTRIIGIAPGASGAVYGTRISMGAAYIENTSQFGITVVPAFGSGGLLIEHDNVTSRSDRLSLGNGFIVFNRDANDVLGLRRDTNAQAFRVYNTFTSATNHERGKLEWSSNVFRVGTEKGSGGGTARAMALQTDGTDRLVADTVGSLQVATALTVATLPASPLVGMIARVTDAAAPAIGSTVTGGGAANALCWYNGTAWTVLGV